MTCPIARPAVSSAALAALLALAPICGAPLAAQQTFNLPPATPTPSPAPAGPADERAGVAIPPRAVPAARPTALPTAPPTAAPSLAPLPTASPARVPEATPSPAPSASRASVPPPRATAAPLTDTLPLPESNLPPAASSTEPAKPPVPTVPSTAPPQLSPPDVPEEAARALPDLPAWWPLVAGGLGAVVVLGGIVLLRQRRRRRPKTMRLAAAPQGADAATAATEPPRLDLTLEITSATRSVMMFTVQYRLAIANRSPRAVNNASVAVQLACARASAGSNAPSAGSAQTLAAVERIGPHQTRAVSGTVQLPLSAIAPLRQGQTPLFIPLVHVTLEGEGLGVLSRTFVIGPKSAGGRVHPIPLDQPPGGIAGLVAQAVALPAASAA